MSKTKTQKILLGLYLVPLVLLPVSRVSAFHNTSPETQQRSVNVVHSEANQDSCPNAGSINKNSISVNEYQILKLDVAVSNSNVWNNGVRVAGYGDTVTVAKGTTRSSNYDLLDYGFVLKFYDGDCISPFAELNVNVEPFNSYGSLVCNGFNYSAGYYRLAYSYHGAHDAILKQDNETVAYLGRASGSHKDSGEHPYYLKYNDPQKNVKFSLYSAESSGVLIGSTTCVVPAYSSALGTASSNPASSSNFAADAAQVQDEYTDGLRDNVDDTSAHTYSQAAAAELRNPTLPAEFYKDNQKPNYTPLIYFGGFVAASLVLIFNPELRHKLDVRSLYNKIRHVLKLKK